MNYRYHIKPSGYFASKPLHLDEPTQNKPNLRKLVELPWQHTKGEMWDYIADVFTTLLSSVSMFNNNFMTVSLINHYKHFGITGLAKK